VGVRSDSHAEPAALSPSLLRTGRGLRPTVRHDVRAQLERRLGGISRSNVNRVGSPCRGPKRSAFRFGLVDRRSCLSRATSTGEWWSTAVGQGSLLCRFTWAFTVRPCSRERLGNVRNVEVVGSSPITSTPAWNWLGQAILRHRAQPHAGRTTSSTRAAARFHVRSTRASRSRR